MAAMTGVILTAAFSTLAANASTYILGSALRHFLVTVALGAAVQALAPKPSISGSNRGYQTNSIGPAQDHQIIYGKMKVGGAIVFEEGTGTNNKHLHRVIAVAGHEVDSFDKIYLNDEEVTVNSSGYVTAPSKYVKTNYVRVKTGEDSEGRPVYTTQATTEYVVRIKTHNGSPNQTADADLVAESTKWTSEHKLRGIAYMYVRLSFDADIFPNGVPVVTAVVKGKKVHDPRNGSIAWSDNPALCLRDYLTNKYGLGENVVNIDDTLVSSAANICDQTNTLASTTRYTCNGAFTTGSTPYDMLSELLKSMGGSMWYAQGKWRMKPAYWTAPVMDLNEDDLRSSISVNTRHSRRDNFNVIKGTFRGEESNWQTTDYPQVTSSAFLAADNNQESVADVDLSFTDNSVEARRLALISLERNRQQLTVNASFGLKTLGLQVGDNIRLTNSRFGWTNKKFEVISWSFGLTDGLDLQTQMILRETAESVFDEVDDGVEYERDNTTLPSPFFTPSVGISPSVVAKVFAEKLVNELTLSTTSGSPESIDKVQVQYRNQTDAGDDTKWLNLSDGPLGKFIIQDLEKGFYEVRARAVNTFGNIGEWEYLFNIEVDALSAPPANVTNFGHELSGGTLFLDWNAVPDLDLSYYQVKHSPVTSGATWGNSSVVLNKVARPATNASLPARSGTFLIKAYDKNLNESVSATSLVVLPSELPHLGNAITITENPAFGGTKTNCIVASNKLRIDNTSSAPSVATYLMKGQSNYIDTNTVRNARVTGEVTFERHFTDGTMTWSDIPNNWSTWPGNWSTWTNEDAAFGDVSVTVYVRATNDDPSGSPTWGAWSLANGATVVGRAFEFKAELRSTSKNFTPNITSLKGKVEY